jgi:hypothetical protein
MSVQGPSSLPLRPLPSAFGAPSRAGTPATAGPGRSAPAAAPDGDSLWELLTEEERAFFSEQASLGALTYGRGRTAAATPPAGPIGQRLDVRG